MAEGRMTKSEMQHKQEMARIAAKYRLWGVALSGAVWVVVLLAAAVPMYFLRDMVDSVAGKRTEVQFALTATIMWGAGASLLAVYFGLRSRSRGEELVRLRSRRMKMDSIQMGELEDTP